MQAPTIAAIDVGEDGERVLALLGREDDALLRRYLGERLLADASAGQLGEVLALLHVEHPALDQIAAVGGDVNDLPADDHFVETRDRRGLHALDVGIGHEGTNPLADPVFLGRQGLGEEGEEQDGRAESAMHGETSKVDVRFASGA